MPNPNNVSATGLLSGSAHPGLRYFKHFDEWTGAWSLSTESRLKFLKKMETLNNSLQSGEGSRLLRALQDRQRAMRQRLEAQGYAVSSPLALTTAWRLVSGLGISHPLETGFAFHHTCGIAYLPGSGIKGAAADVCSDTMLAQRIFGGPNASGQVIFFDAFPTKWPKLEIDIINPHYPDYYDGSAFPSDWQSPVPIQFLAVAHDQPFEFFVAVKPQSDRRAEHDLLAHALGLVRTAATESGLGGKSGVGYGYFR